MKKSVRILWRLFFLGLFAVLGVFLLAGFGFFGKMPSLQELENPEADLASTLMTADGKLMGKYYAENRSEVKYDQIPQNVIEALIATEDQHFYDHSGIDAKALARAVFRLGTDGGGSPITQQLAKMIMRQGQGNIFTRGLDKIKEWIVATKLERNFTKEEIITLYLNRAPWGNVYGLRNASLMFFSKEPIKLKTEEAAVLVGMLKGYKNYNPITGSKALLRRNTVLNRMVDTKQHYLTQAEADAFKAKPLVTDYKKIDEELGIAPYYRRSVVDEIQKWCEQTINPKTGEPYNLYRDGLTIYTTIDSKMQQYAEDATVNHLPVLQKRIDAQYRGQSDRLWKGKENILRNAMKYSERWKNMKEREISEEEIIKSFSVPVKMKIFSWKGDSNHEMDTVLTPMDSIKYHKLILQTSFVCMDPRTGEVKAYVGGPDYRWFKYDNAQAMRQVGSTIKPLLYTLAVTDAGYGPETVIGGGALTLNGKTISGGGGTMARCLAMSINGAAWHLIAMIGAKRLVEFAHTVGISVKLGAYPSLALGAAEIPIVQMLQSYTMFPNKGYNTSVVYLSRIEDKNGNLLHEFPIAQSKQVIGEVDAYTMVTMMEGVIKNGTARRVNSYNIPVEKAGKTGTTNGNTDGWFIGYTPELLAGSWIGAADPFIRVYSTSGGAEMSAPRWGYFMEHVYADKKLNYGSIKVFEAPLEAKLDPISADANYYDDENKKPVDLNLIDDAGNGSADDFFSDNNGDYFVDTIVPIKKTPKQDPPPAKTIKEGTTMPPKAKNEKEDPKKPKPKTGGEK